MRLAIISDIHGNSVALQKVIEDMSYRNVSEAIILGDLIVKGPDPKGVLELLKNLNLVCCIKGNTDKWLENISDDWKPTNHRDSVFYDCYQFMKKQISFQEVKFIKDLPEKQSLLLDKLNVLCVHGSPRQINEEMKPDFSDEELLTILTNVEEDIILSGHIHHPFIRQVGLQDDN